LESIQQREEHWVIADLVGKGGHIRTVPMPAWVKAVIDAWRRAASLTHGRVFRAINQAGRYLAPPLAGRFDSSQRPEAIGEVRLGMAPHHFVAP